MFGTHDIKMIFRDSLNYLLNIKLFTQFKDCSLNVSLSLEGLKCSENHVSKNNELLGEF